MCPEHFDPSCYISNTNRLLKDAIPIIFPIKAENNNYFNSLLIIHPLVLLYFKVLYFSELLTMASDSGVL